MDADTRRGSGNRRIDIADDDDARGSPTVAKTAGQVGLGSRARLSAR
jgi:hypothetical protein